MNLAHSDGALPRLHRIGLASNETSDEDLACFAASGTPLVKRVTHLDVSDSPAGQRRDVRSADGAGPEPDGAHPPVP
jgi:hypothetical protein